jgi:Winged helix DNA-binding domain
VDESELRSRRSAAQLLDASRPRSAPNVVERLVAVQAQDLRSARLALRARSSGLTATDVERELTEQRSLVVGWLLRGTLHLVRRGGLLVAARAHRTGAGGDEPPATG